MASERIRQDGGRDRIGRLLYVFYILGLLAGVGIMLSLILIQVLFKPDSDIKGQLTPSIVKQKEAPVRGSILACDGRTFAISFTHYEVGIDPSVQKSYYEQDSKNGAKLEKEWREKARVLSTELAEIFPSKSSSEYYKMIIKGRDTDSHYKAIATDVDYRTLQKIKTLTLFEEGANKGGLVVNPKQVRQYPYEQLARRTIGFIRENTANVTNNFIGIEGKFDNELRGKEGYAYTKKVDGNRRVTSYDSTAVKAVDGLDVRTTLNIDFQDIADRAIRAQIDSNRKIEGACAVVMEVKTGAIRAMVNLKRNSSNGKLEEGINYAVGRAGEPGSVFKLTTLMTLMEDGYVESLEETIPTNHGQIKNLPVDSHITDFERNNKTDRISILNGLEMSSNYVFAYLATEHYSKKPGKFIEKIKSYKLAEAYDFDLDGMATPSVPSPDKKGWSGSSLGSVAYGYSVTETPLHILTFYNAIANKGKMMKPYLVEDLERHGSVETKMGPSILNSSICSRATADTLTRGLVSVVKNGTATRLKNTKWTVAGKTGTARIVLDSNDSKTRAGKYEDESGRRKNQATFVGFFPAENPLYSIIVVVYSVLDRESFYGGTLPALAAKDIVDGIWALEPSLRPELKASASVPVMSAAKMEECADDIVPDLKGLGLREAMYLIEKGQHVCSYSGVGHVYSQTPQAGTKIKKGETIKISLKQ